MASDFIFFVKAPDLNNLVTLVLEISAFNGDATISLYHRRILKCRELIFTIPQLLATPELRSKCQILAIVPKKIYENDEFRDRIEKIGFQIIDVIEVTDGILQECFHYSAIARLAPNWNLVGDMLVQGRDFLVTTGSMNAIRFEVVAASEEMHLNLHAFCIKMPSLKLEYYQHSFHYQEWKHEGNPEKPLTIPLSEECHVLPSLKQATLLSITNYIPKGSCFGDYKDFKKHWKNMYGYRLPDLPPKGILYCNVAFHVFRKTIYAYPMLCIRPCEPNVIPRIDPKGILCNFLNDFHRKIGTICGQSCQLVELRPAFADMQLYPANELKKDMKPRCGTTYSAPNKPIPYRKNARASSPTKSIPSTKPYYTPKPFNLLNLCTPPNSENNRLSSKPKVLSLLNSEDADSLAKFKKSPQKSYKPFQGSVQKEKSSGILPEDQNALLSRGFPQMQQTSDATSSNFKFKPPSYQPKNSKYIETYADDYLQYNIISHSPFPPSKSLMKGQMSTFSASSNGYRDSPIYPAQGLVLQQSQEVEKVLGKSPFYPLQTFVQKSQISPQTLQRPCSQLLGSSSSENLSSANEFFSPLATETLSTMEDGRKVFESIMHNKVPNQAITERWSNASPYRLPESYLTSSQESPVSRGHENLATSASFGNSTHSLHQKPLLHLLDDKIPSEIISPNTELFGTSLAANAFTSTPILPKSQLPLNHQKSKLINQHNAMDKLLAPSKAPKYLSAQELRKLYPNGESNNQIPAVGSLKGHPAMAQQCAVKSPWFSNIGEEQQLPLSFLKSKRMKSSEKACRGAPVVKIDMRRSVPQVGPESLLQMNPVAKDLFHKNAKISPTSNQPFISTPVNTNSDSLPHKTVDDFYLSPIAPLDNCTKNTNRKKCFINEQSCNKLPSQTTSLDKESFPFCSKKPNSIQSVESKRLLDHYDGYRNFPPVNEFHKLDLDMKDIADTVSAKPINSENGTHIHYLNDRDVDVEQQMISSTPHNLFNDVENKQYFENTPIKCTSDKREVNVLNTATNTAADSFVDIANKSDEINGITVNGKKLNRRKKSSAPVARDSTKPKKIARSPGQALMEAYISKLASRDSLPLKNQSSFQEMPELTSKENNSQPSTLSLYDPDLKENTISSINQKEKMIDESPRSSPLLPLPEKRSMNSSHISTNDLTLTSNRHIVNSQIIEQTSAQPGKVIPKFFKKHGTIKNNQHMSTPVSRNAKLIPNFFSKKKTSNQPANENGKTLFPDAVLAVKVTRGKPKASKTKPVSKRKIKKIDKA